MPEALLCPNCGAAGSSEERFCSRCGLPLVLDAPPADASRRRELARKIKPQLAEGPLERAVGARNQAEAEFIQALLLEEGVPSLLRRTAGFDVPDFLAAGPRDVLVPRSGLDTAREVLLEADLIAPAAPVRVVRPLPLLAGILGALVLGGFVLWIGLQLLGH